MCRERFSKLLWEGNNRLDTYTHKHETCARVWVACIYENDDGDDGTETGRGLDVAHSDVLCDGRGEWNKGWGWEGDDRY